MKSKSLLALLALGFAVGCATMKVNTDYAREADFSKYKTFAYTDMENNIEDTNPLGHRRIVEGIRREMLGKGLQETGSNPDLYVTYYGEDKEQVSLDTTSFGYGYGPGWYWGGGMGTTTTQVRTYTQGTLIVDIWDAKAKQLVWRGVASDTISDNPEKNIAKLNKALAKMFERYPPGS
jgi:hypothetical protein